MDIPFLPKATASKFRAPGSGTGLGSIGALSCVEPPVIDIVEGPHDNGMQWTAFLAAAGAEDVKLRMDDRLADLAEC